MTDIGLDLTSPSLKSKLIEQRFQYEASAIMRVKAKGLFDSPEVSEQKEEA